MLHYNKASVIDRFILVEVVTGNSCLNIDRQPVPRDNFIMDTLERARLLITEAMGIGTDRTVEITSGGNTIQGPSIQIVEGVESGILAGPVELVAHAELPASSIALFCQNGRGTIYLYRTDRSFIRIDKTGSTATLFNDDALVDQQGPFRLTVLHAGGVDPTERYLYFSATTTDGNSDNATQTIFRFCRYDLQNNTLITLNRSAYPNVASQRVLSAYTPFEGPTATVKLFAATGVYPASNGNIFLDINSSSSIAKIDVSGQLTYVIRAGQNLPVIYNPSTRANFPEGEVSRLLPGVVLANGLSSIRAIYPDDGFIYLRLGAFADNIRQVDLNNAVEVFGFTPTYVPAIFGGAAPYISGTFGILTGSYETSNPPGLFGYLPLPGARVLLLYYQGLDNHLYPALGTLNFNERVGRRYAPGKVLLNGFVMNTADRILNYDEEGMIYLTANNNTAIIKTSNQ